MYFYDTYNGSFIASCSQQTMHAIYSEGTEDSSRDVVVRESRQDEAHRASTRGSRLVFVGESIVIVDLPNRGVAIGSELIRAHIATRILVRHHHSPSLSKSRGPDTLNGGGLDPRRPHDVPGWHPWLRCTCAGV